MRRPLLCLLLFYILGIIIGQYILDIFFIVLFFVIIIISSILLYKKYKWIGVFIFPIFTLIGFIMLNFSITPHNTFIEAVAQEQKIIKIEGKVLDIDYTTTGRQKIIINTNSIFIENSQIDDNLNIQAILDIGIMVEYNQMVIISGKLQCFDFVRNPGAFDERLYMKTKKIDYKMFAQLIKTGDTINNFNTYLYKIHQKFNNVYDTILPEKESSILKAMLLGDKKNLDNSIKEVYQKAGISHILAISGLHISILSGFLWIILNHIGFNKKINSTIVLIILCLYCIFTGNSVSTIRAVTMIGIVLIGTIIYKESDIYTSIGTAALILLLYQPLYLYDVGFQLSFGAVTGIIILSPILERVIHIPKAIKPYIISTLAATLVTYPIIAFHFNTISVVGLMVNIFVLPFVAVLVGFGLMAGIIGIFSIVLGKFICGIVYFTLILYEFICTIATNIIFSELLIGEPNIIIIAIYYIIVLIIVYYYYNIPKERLAMKKYIISSITIFLIIGIVIMFIPKKLEIVYLDIGQGDSIAIHTPDNKNILIDGGGNIFKQLGEANTGTQTILPYLKYKGINSLDYVFVSHPDGDHILGIIEIIDYIKIKQIIVSENNDINDNELFIILKNKADKYSIPIVKMGEKDVIDLKNNLYIKCLYPDENTYIDSYNNGSLVICMEYNKRVFTFTGDIEKEAEYNISNKYTKLYSDVLKVPHHGSKTSSTKELLNIVNPSVAIISSGRNNSYGHPHKEVIDRYKDINTIIYNTAEQGAITIKSNGDKITISTMKERQLR